MSEGWIYIASTPIYAEKGLYKIGMTTQSPEGRARELSQATGVPENFRVFFTKDFSDCKLAERMIHEKLSSYRYTKNREFFDVSLDEAKAVVYEVAEQIGAALTFEKNINLHTLASYLSIKYRDRRPSSSTDVSKLARNLLSNPLIVWFCNERY